MSAARVVGVGLGKVNRRVKRLALAQSHDVTASVTRAGARVMRRPPTPPSALRMVAHGCSGRVHCERRGRHCPWD
ncbi:hypothetical protein G6048_19660 [Streptomyces sp. YC419]|uniref:Uncharacterized protein n=1 Tax=Streptomyces ureilyticus TaxID=1775131 RepID=A0ABX0DSE6_9ACTN|nr:hypothetical protein [Streptomyces ureilyticus]